MTRAAAMTLAMSAFGTFASFRCAAEFCRYRA